jgi:hypothetical protein
MPIFKYTWWLWPTLAITLWMVQLRYTTRFFGYAVFWIDAVLFVLSSTSGLIGIIELLGMKKSTEKELLLLKTIICLSPATLLVLGVAVGMFPR